MWTPWESDGERWQGQCCVDLLASSLIILSRIELHFFLWTVMSWTQHWTGSDEKQTWHGEAVSLSRLCPRCLCLKFRTRKLQEDGETDGGVEWLEFSLLHRIDHFFVYTFKGTEDVVKEVLMPYLKAGLATRIHFDVPQYPRDKTLDMCGWHFDWVIRDCLYQAKSHATWVIPSFDFDEYFYIFPPEQWQHLSRWQDSTRLWCHRKISKQKSRGSSEHFFQTISLRSCSHWHFGDFFPMVWGASPGALGATGHHGGLAEVPKYNVHVAPVVTSVVTTFRSSNLLEYKLTQAIEQRFGQNLPALLKRFSEAIQWSDPTTGTVGG